MTSFFVLILMLIAFKAIDYRTDNKIRRKQNAMKINGHFRNADYGEWANLMAQYKINWEDGDRSLFEPEWIPALEKDRIALQLYMEIKIALYQWGKGLAPVHGVVHVCDNLDPNIQWRYFVMEYSHLLE